MTEIYPRLRSDIIAAVKGRQTDKAIALRTVDGAIQRAAIDQNTEIGDDLALGVIRKTVKDLEGAREQFAQGGREDLVRKNETEIAWLREYLPPELDAGALARMVDEAVEASGAASPRDIGKVMGILKKRPEADRIDFGEASRMIREKLG